MASLDDILGALPIDQIASSLGVDPETACSALESVLPAVVGGLERNAQDPAGASSLADALATKDTSILDGGVSIDQIDANDGQKILGHIFGDQTDNVARALGSNSGGVDSALISKLLPMIAPVVLAYLAKQVGGGGQAATANSGGGLGDLLSSVLSGGLGGGKQSSGGIGDILGAIFGNK